MIVKVNHSCADFNSFRAQKVKSLFNAESGHEWSHTASLPIEGDEWQIGLIVGPSGSGKSSLGKQIWGEEHLYDPSRGWRADATIVDCIGEAADFKEVTASLSAVGIGDVPAWLRPFHVLSNGEQFRAGLARLAVDAPEKVVVDEFTSVIDRQVAKIGAAAFAKSWRRKKGKQVVLLSCHYDVVEWLQPDWVYDTRTGALKKKSSGDRYIGRLARTFDIPIIPAGTLCDDTMAKGVDLGITAHSFDYIGKKTRYKTKLGWIGFHPSILPRHRGRSAIEWAVRMKDIITGGTVYWLNSGIDRGDIAYQDWCWIDPKYYARAPREAARELWRDEIMPIGVRLMEQALTDISKGVIVKKPQDDRFSTFEPSTNVRDVFKPDLLMLPLKTQ